MKHIIAIFSFILLAVTGLPGKGRSQLPDQEYVRSLLPVCGDPVSPFVSWNEKHHGVPDSLDLLGDDFEFQLREHILFSSTFCSERDGDRLYVGAGSALLIYELGEGGVPLYLGHCYTPDIIWNIAVRRDTVYLANGDDGMRIIDCTDPTDPLETGALEVGGSGYALGIDVRRNIACLANQVGGLLTIDISDPTMPVHLGTFNPGAVSDYIAADVRVLGSTAYAVFTTLNPAVPSLLGLIDISVPEEPDSIRCYPTGLILASTPRAVHVEPDSTVFIANGTHKDLLIFDCSRPYFAEEIGYFQGSSLMSLDVTVSGDRIYLADGYRGTGIPNFFVFEKDQISPDMEPAGSYMTLNIAWGVSTKGDTAYVSDEWGGLAVLDCSSPGQIELLGTLDLGGYPHDLALTEDRIYVASKGGNVRVVSRGEENLEEAGIVDPLGLASGIIVHGDTLFVAEGADYAQGPAGVEIFEASVIGEPRLVGSLDLGWEAHCYDLAVDGELIYAANGSTGLRIIDASDRTDPWTLNIVDTPGKALEVFLEGNIAYVADGGEGLRLIDISIPESAYEINAIATPGSTSGVWVEDTIAYLADGEGGLRIVDCHDPAALFELGSSPIPGRAYQVQVVDSLAFVTCQGGGIVALDVGDPGSPCQLSWYETAGKAHGLLVEGRKVFLTDWYGGLYLLEYSWPTGIHHDGDFQIPRDFSLSQNVPNPFNPQTVIEFEIPSPGYAELTAYSVRGRIVGTLLSEMLEEGRHRVAWDGRDEHGTKLPGGIYLYRLVFTPRDGTPQRSVTKKLEVLR